MSEGKFKSRRHYAQYSQDKRLFDKVVEAYTEFREYAPVVACQYDPEARSKKLVPAILHFLADVDIATKAVLKTDALLRQWEALVLGEEITPGVAAELIAKCSRIYRARHLAPWEYFNVLKKPLQRAAGAAA